METYYYLDTNSQQQGPISESELIQYGVTRGTQVWREDMSDWQSAGSVPELSGIFQPQPKTSVIYTIDTKMAKKSLFTFPKSYFNYIGKGKLFGLVYIINAILSLLLPFIIMYVVIDNNYFENAGVNYVFAFIFMWLMIVFACWIGSLLWWNRRKKVTEVGSSEFIAFPIIADIIQTSGEWLGTLLGIIGGGGGLLTTIFLGNDIDRLFEAMGMEFMQFGILTIIIWPIIGFCIVLLSRFLAELLRVFASLANNTKEIANNIKNNTAGNSKN